MADRCDNTNCTNPAKWQIESTDPNLPGSWQLCVPCKLHYDAARSIDPARSRRGVEELTLRGAAPQLLAQTREAHSAPVRRLPVERSRPGEPPGRSLTPTDKFNRFLSQKQQEKANRHQAHLEWVAEQLRQRGHEFPDRQHQAQEPAPFTREDIVERLNQRLARQEQERQQRQRERQERQRGRELGD